MGSFVNALVMTKETSYVSARSVREAVKLNWRLKEEMEQLVVLLKQTKYVSRPLQRIN